MSNRRCERCDTRDNVEARSHWDRPEETEDLCDDCYAFHYECSRQAQRHLAAIATEGR
jgi:hypothetical protein